MKAVSSIGFIGSWVWNCFASSLRKSSWPSVFCGIREAAGAEAAVESPATEKALARPEERAEIVDMENQACVWRRGEVIRVPREAADTPLGTESATVPLVAAGREAERAP